MKLEFPVQVTSGISTEPEVIWRYVCNAEEVEQKESTAVKYLILLVSPRRYTLECTQQALVSCTCTLFTYSHTAVSRPHLTSKNASLVPRLSRNSNMYRGESLVSFLRKHDVIKKELNRKVTLCALFNQLCVQRLVCWYSTPVVVSLPLALLFFLFWVSGTPTHN